jgi:predicted enzyme related to lactoylglutathione lyase
MANSVVHFAVYCDDAERAITFYGDVFSWSFEPWGPPGYWKISTGGKASDPGVAEGALSQRTEPRGEGTPNAYRCTITVADLDAFMKAVEQHGGTVRQPVADIPNIGRVVEFLDTEGNLACLMQYAEGDPRAVK